MNELKPEKPQEVPSLTIVQSKVEEGKLHYPNLKNKVNEVDVDTEQRIKWALSTVHESEDPNVLNERSLALDDIRSHRAARLILKIQESEDDGKRELYEKRLFDIHIARYGKADLAEAKKIYESEIKPLLEFADDTEKEFLDSIYQTLTSGEFDSTETSVERNENIHSEIKEALHDKFPLVFDYFNQQLEIETTHDSDSIKKHFDSIIKIMSEQDSNSDWKNWETEIIPESAPILVDRYKSKILVSKDRKLSSTKALKGLIFHEILVHSQRAVNARDGKREDLHQGLYGYETAEEGLAIVIELTVTGEKSKSTDKYFNIAAAQTVNPETGHNPSFQDILKLKRLKDKLRLKSEGKSGILNDEQESKAIDHVKRIYRSGMGDNKEKLHPIFTKDIVYYEGYKEIINWISRTKSQGASMQSILDYLLQGKFDPNNKNHKKIVKPIEDF